MFLVSCVLWSAAPASAQGPSAAAPVGGPYRKAAPERLDFRGPGREEPEPGVEDVVLGWFGPGDPDHPAFGTSWRGAMLAIEEANAAGGYRPAAGSRSGREGGLPFRLEPAWSESPWQAGIGTVLRLVYEQHAWAVIGGVDGTSTHLALQVALKSHVPLVSPGSTDVSTDRANVPWLFSLAPSDESLASVVVPALAAAARGGSFAIAASADHDGHAALLAFRHELNRYGIAPAALVEFAASGDDLALAAARVLAPRPGAALVLGPALSSGAFVAALRRAGFTGPVFGSGTASSHAFREAAGRAAERLVAAAPVDAGTSWDEFAIAYRKRWGDEPDAWAANGYDAVRLVVAAIKRAGLNRARIRDEVAALAPWSGAGGVVRWSAVGRNERPVVPSTWRDGRFVPVEQQFIVPVEQHFSAAHHGGQD